MYESDQGRDRSSTHPTITWITNHPLLFWGGVWTIALSVTVGVTAGLLHGKLFVTQESLDLPPTSREDSLATRDEREFEVDPQDNPEAVYFKDTARSPSQAKNLFPLWLMGFIALTCAAGSFFVTLVLKSLSLSQKQPVKHLKPKTISQEMTPVSTPRFQTEFGSIPYEPVIIAETQPRVTVLPPEVISPLDSPQNDGNLLEQLDLRKRHSLSSLMDYTDDE
ncbi:MULTISPECIES: hypothetical protein [Spirulina sp. CCY15215]|uniref:hypothetical protein n=1 Tax=Spirulina sp. CCY15215 TaxID=2767591 RepID=UPI0019520D16|nr:hypothetical protein [Spirulina major]